MVSGLRRVLAGMTIVVVAMGSAKARDRNSLPLAKLRRIEVEVGAQVKGSLVVHMLANDRTEPDRCVPPAAKATATFNGKRLRRLRGPYQNSDDDIGDHDCLLDLALPAGSVESAARAPAGGLLEIVEAETRVVFEIPDALAPRELTFVSPMDGVLHPGQAVTLRWQPATDDISQGDLEVRPRGSKNARDGIVIPKKDSSIQGDRITFTMPKELPANLRGEVEVLYDTTPYFVRLRSGPCPVDHCSVSGLFVVAPLAARLVGF